MKKLISIITLVTCSLFTVACNAKPSNETRTCTYNLDSNEKTCNLSQNEREDVLKTQIKAIDKIKVVEGKSYREQQDGTLVPVQQ